MNIGQKGQMHQYLPDVFEFEEQIKSARIFEPNDEAVNEGIIVYLIEREIRLEDNFALNLAFQKSEELQKPLKLIHHRCKYDNENKQKFIDAEIERVKSEAVVNNIDFIIFEGSEDELINYINEINTAVLIRDFNPISPYKKMNSLKIKTYEVDGHNIIPARFVSDRQELSAFTFRKSVYNYIGEFLTEIPSRYKSDNEAHMLLREFIETKLPQYEEFKNNPVMAVTSGLSKYMNLGFISSQRIVLEVVKSEASQGNKEVFLEEMIVRKELSDNFCHYNDKYKTLSGIPNWARETLKDHLSDIRTHVFSLKALENAQTYDDLWNASQIQLMKEGKIEGYLRMYWAKKIGEWSRTPQSAVKTAIYLNDKYAYDSPAANGYVGILWSIGGLHDRAFAERPVTGKIRSMTYNGAKSKFDVQAYIDRYSVK